LKYNCVVVAESDHWQPAVTTVAAAVVAAGVAVAVAVAGVADVVAVVAAVVFVDVAVLSQPHFFRPNC